MTSIGRSLGRTDPFVQRIGHCFCVSVSQFCGVLWNKTYFQIKRDLEAKYHQTKGWGRICCCHIIIAILSGANAFVWKQRENRKPMGTPLWLDNFTISFCEAFTAEMAVYKGLTKLKLNTRLHCHLGLFLLHFTPWFLIIWYASVANLLKVKSS